MAFQDPASSFFGPAAGGREESRGTNRVALQDIPSAANIGSPNNISIKNPGSVQYKEDRTWETVFKGAASLGNTAIEATDAVIKLDIDDTLRKGVRNIQEQHLAAATDIKQDILDTSTEDRGNTPIGLQQGLQRMDTLQKAKRYGSIGDSNYNAQLSELVGGLKTRYAGYEREIDNKIKEISGVDPANALRVSMQADIDAMQKANQAKRSEMDKWRDTNAKYLAGIPNVENYSYKELQKIVGEKKATEYEIDMDRKRLDWEKDRGVDIQSKTEKAFNKAGTNVLSSSMSAMFSDPSIAAFINNPDPSKLDATTIKNIETALNIYERQLDTGLDSLANTKLGNSNDGTTYLTEIAKGGDYTRFKNAKEVIKQPFLDFKNSLLNKDTGALTFYSRYIKNIEDIATADIYDKHKFLRYYKSMTNAVGANAMGVLASSQGNTLIKELATAAQDAVTMRNLGSSVTAGEPLSIQLQRGRENGFKNTDFLNNVRGITTIITSKDPATKPEAKLNAAKSVFEDPDQKMFLRSLGPDEKMNGFTRMINDETRTSVKDMGPNMYGKYQSWAHTNFQYAFRETADTVVDVGKSNPYVDVKYNVETGRIEYTPNAAGMKYYRGDMVAWREGVGSEFINKVDKLNAGIAAMENVYKDGGIDPKQQVGAMINSMGLKDEGVKKEGFLYNLRKSTGEAIMKLQDNSKRKLPSTDLPTLIRKGEAGGNYNAIFGGGDVDITGMTVDELLAVQDKRVAQGAKSSAAGGYQFLRKTLRSLKDEMGLSGSETMTPQFQDKLALKLMERRGLNDYKSGKISKGQFIDNLSKEWASLPNTSGKGSYDGDGLNAANVPLATLIDVLDEV